MKKMKRLLAVLLTMVMVMGMAVTAMAETSATGSLDIPVTGADGATFKYAQLIEVDNTTETGWAFVSDGIAEIYMDKLKTDTAQKAIWKLIKKVVGDEAVAGMPEDTVAATDGEISAALRAIKNADPAIITLEDGKIVTKPGVYYIDAEEEGYVYNPMTAYVSFYVYTEGKPSGLESAGTVAKKADTTVEKTNDNGDAVTEIGKDVTYTITTTVPYISYDNNNSYVITDTISGAEYKLNTDKELIVKVKVGDAEEVSMEATLNGTNSFSLNLDYYAKDKNRSYAGQTLVITYVATVTDMEVHNNVITNDGDHSSYANNFLFAGTATLTKKDEKDEKVVLEGAKFIIKKDATYATFSGTKETGYTLTGWVTDEDKATLIETKNDGTVTVKGLDSSETYQFVEKVAPNGYSVNTTPVDIKWNNVTTEEEKIVGDTAVKYIKTTATGVATMLDTKLSALPATGGIGTTIFTVVGCLIMVAAAGMFFANKRRA